MDSETKQMQRGREILALHEGGWSYADIGRLIGITGNRVSHIARETQNRHKRQFNWALDSAHVRDFHRQPFEQWKKRQQTTA